MMGDIRAFRHAVISRAGNLASATVPGLESFAIDDVTAIFEQTIPAIGAWSRQRAQNEISEDEYKELIAGAVQSAPLVALTEAGAAVVRVERFRTRLGNLLAEGHSQHDPDDPGPRIAQ